jgi:hypothetical protein
MKKLVGQLSFAIAVMTFCAVRAFAQGPISPTRVPGPNNQTPTQTSKPAAPAASKQSELKKNPPPAAEYNLGAMARSIAALEAQVEALKKQNQLFAAQNKALEGKVAALQAWTNYAQQTANTLKQLDAEFRNHTHRMPNIGIMALSAIPGMQQIANSAGIGGVKAQWDTMKMLWIDPYTKGVDFVGPATPQ